MTTPYDPYATATQALPSAQQSQIPGNIIGQFGNTINTSEINFTSDANGGVFGYSGAPGVGNLYFALAPVGGSDSFGNTYTTGINVLAGNVQGVSIIGASMDSTSTLLGSNIQAPTVLNPSVSGGTAAALVHTMTNANGGVLGYVSSSTSVTYATNTVATFTVPTGVTSLRVQCWGAGGGGNGSNTTQGGPGGGGGEYAEEPNYQVNVGDVYNIVVGKGGAGAPLNTSGGDGVPSQVYAESGSGNPLPVTAQGGFATDGYFLGGSGGQGSTNTIHFNGGPGANGSGNTGAGGGGSSAGPGGAGNTGAQSSGATGGAGGGAPSGGGAGGTGGNNTAAGGAGSAPGGGGGGLGANAGAAQQIVEPFSGSWAYYGSDASTPNALANHNGPMYQGYQFTGVNYNHMYTYLLLRYAALQAALSGATIISVYLRIHNLHSHYSSGMYCNVGYSSLSSFGSKGDGGASRVNDFSFFLKQGQLGDFDVTGSGAFGAAIQSGAAKSVILGPAAANGQGFNYAGYFDSGSNGTQPELIVNYWPASAGATSGKGADGQIILTYNSGTVPTFQLSVSATSGSDTFGNPFNAGFAGPNFVAPGSNSTVSTLNSGGLTVQTASNSGTVGSSATPVGLNGQQLILFSQSSSPGSVSTGAMVFANTNTDLKYINFNDGNSYNTGTLYITTPNGGKSITSALTAAYTGTVATGLYKVSICFAHTTTNSGSVTWSWTGTSTCDDSTGIALEFVDGGTIIQTQVVNTSGKPGNFGSRGFSNSTTWAQTYEMQMHFSGGGTLIFNGQTSTGTITIGSYGAMTISPISTP